MHHKHFGEDIVWLHRQSLFFRGTSHREAFGRATGFCLLPANRNQWPNAWNALGSLVVLRRPITGTLFVTGSSVPIQQWSEVVDGSVFMPNYSNPNSSEKTRVVLFSILGLCRGAKEKSMLGCVSRNWHLGDSWPMEMLQGDHGKQLLQCSQAVAKYGL